jgi:L-seryl-tRNA(Ser) seleniumtransferase
MVGFTERPSLEELVELGKRRNIPTFEDLGSGCLADLSSVGIADEPVAGDSIRAGVDIISFSGDKLLGGPQAGIIAGKKLYVEKIRQNPLFRAFRVDKLTISILEFVVRAYLTGKTQEIPVWRMLHISPDALKSRAESFAQMVGKGAQAIALESVVGGGSAPEAYMPSWGITLNVKGFSDAELERSFRNSNPPVIVRLEEGRVVLDFRTIFPDEEKELLAVLEGIQKRS